ncbi:MAG: fumarylacetoacetate hydrolase family protein [Bacteroidales bacterium]|nr:fumarylacetoacetate hydrolase family protein [Bacteroidales bacterium]MBD5222437.1 fumarylacetoacetate hydrolase family protein [Bacteroidales bacterium]MBD5302780.1 fumarylacetoacetate hydrolase family protein [Bacteroides sp.]
MKIFAIINNTPDPLKKSPFRISEGSIDWYEMPDSSVLRSGNPFFVPDFASEFQAFPSIVYRIGRLGKSIAPRFASRYIDSITMGAAVVATDLLGKLRATGAPWTRATSFDRSLLLGNLQPIETLLYLDEVEITCGDSNMTYRTGDLLAGIESVISILSKDNTLKNGDLILAGLTPQGIELKPDTRLCMNSKTGGTILDFNIR